MVTVVVGAGYVRSFPGALKLTQIVASLVALIVIVCAVSSGKATAFLVAAAGSLIISVLYLFLFLTALVAKIRLPWLSLEMLLAVLWSIFYIIVSAIVIATDIDSYIAAGSFGLLASLAYLIEAGYRFKNR